MDLAFERKQSETELHIRGEPPSAFIFDVDGVLADTAGLHAAAWRTAVTEHGFYFPEHVVDLLRGMERRASLELILRGQTMSGSVFESILNRKNDLYVTHVTRMTPADALTGADPFLKSLRKRGIRTAAVSASRNARAVLQSVGLLSQFIVVIDGNEGAATACERFALAAARLNLPVADCVGVEDSAVNLRAIRSLGMKTIGVGPAIKAGSADVVISSWDDPVIARFIAAVTSNAHAMVVTAGR